MSSRPEHMDSQIRTLVCSGSHEVRGSIPLCSTKIQTATRRSFFALRKCATSACSNKWLIPQELNGIQVIVRGMAPFMLRAEVAHFRRMTSVPKGRGRPPVGSRPLWEGCVRVDASRPSGLYGREPFVKGEGGKKNAARPCRSCPRSLFWESPPIASTLSSLLTTRLKQPKPFNFSNFFEIFSRSELAKEMERYST